ncbi:hypothetical protein ACP6PL_10835 [Dapis sp. BLCC M126]|uniref:hypothetical protein n=1 Tax=Dapis sp. BLCC M126 TaxID=3400189 RepID=UPI003CFB6FC7
MSSSKPSKQKGLQKIMCKYTSAHCYNCIYDSGNPPIMLGVKPWLKLLAFLAYTVNDTRKIIRHLLKYNLKLRTDIVAACELELYINSLISPFYLWKNGYLSQVDSDFTTEVESQIGLSVK